ncbi:MAG TPA: hypothetical protein PKY70_12470 [Nakamurella multipartita]|jgi:hypothetical protein|nr:hypothetical protein [Nakamurella multipartita]
MTSPAQPHTHRVTYQAAGQTGDLTIRVTDQVATFCRAYGCPDPVTVAARLAVAARHALTPQEADAAALLTITQLTEGTPS